MSEPLSQSRTRRLLKRVGVSLLQAALVGSLVGILVNTRPSLGGERTTLLQRARFQVEAVELKLYDWRARQLARASPRSDAVRLVAIDDETLAEARRDARPGVSAQPWPRELLGGLVDQMLREGATHVLLHPVLPDLSPRTCSGAPDPDDARFRRWLDGAADRSTLAFSWRDVPERYVGARPSPLLVQVGEAVVGNNGARLQCPPEPAGEAAGGASRPVQSGCELVRRVLADQRQAFWQYDGDRAAVWAGAASVEDVRAVRQAFALPADAPVRPLEPKDRNRQVEPLDLFLALSEVQVEGIDPDRLTQARAIQHPTAVLLGERSTYGGVTAPAGLDGVVRAFPHLVRFVHRDRKVLLPSGPLAAVMALTGTRKLRYADGRLRIGDRYSIPMDESGFSLVQWETAEVAEPAWGSLRSGVTAWKVAVNLFNRSEGLPPRYPNDLAEKVAVLTNTSSYSSDFVATPVGPSVSGGALAGQALANLLTSRGVVRADPLTDVLLTFALAFFGAVLALAFAAGFRSVGGALTYFLSLCIATAAYAALARHLFVHERLWVAVAGPSLAMVASFLLTTLYAFRTEREIRDFVYGVLGRYVSPEVARKVSSDLTLMRPERRTVTLYLSDIEGFTSLSERLTPEQLVHLLNDYLNEMTTIVQAHQGQVDKYIGDAVMAFWGAPVPSQRHAYLACEAALKMREALTRKQPAWEKQYGQRIFARAAVNTGEVVAGDMGSALKSSYTVMGSPVNAASWLQAANKLFGTFILVGESTYELTATVFTYREVDRIQQRGRPGTTRIYELVARRGRLPPEKARMLSLFTDALEAYQERRFTPAKELFARCVQEYADPVSVVYVDRCQRLTDAPPPADWDGVFEQRDR